MNYLVTGCAGFIGSHFARMALNKGHKVCGVDTLAYSGNRETIEDIINNPNFTFHAGDISEELRIAKVLKSNNIDVVVNFAAESHVDKSITNPILFAENNTLGTCKLLDSCYHYWTVKGKPDNFRYIQISTDEVYGSSVSGEFTEECQYRPNSPYAASKAAADHFVRSYNKTFGLPTIITNCSNNFGPYQYPEKLIPLMILRCLSGENLPVYGDGQNVRDWIHVTDHCAAVLHLVDRGTPGQSYLIGASKPIKNIDLVQTICRLLDTIRPKNTSYHEQITYVTDRPGHDGRYAVDWSKLASTGWIPLVTFSAGLQDTIKWYLNNQPWLDAINAKTHRQGLL